MTLSIRPFRHGDEEALWALFRNTIRHVNRKDYSDEQVRAWAPDTIDPERWQQVMDVNLTANWRLIRCLDPLLRQSDAGRAVDGAAPASYAGQARCFPALASAIAR